MDTMNNNTTTTRIADGFVSPSRSPVSKNHEMVMDPPLSTKREKQLRTPARFRPPQAPRLTKTAPNQNRYYSTSRDSLYDPYASVVTFKECPSQAPQLSKEYLKGCEETYLFQRFTVQGRLGQGSFGEVISVRSKDDGKLYAVKCSLDLYRNLNDRRTKIQEVKKHEMMPPHPNLIRFIKAWEERGRLYIQTELCKKSLDDIACQEHEIHEPEIWYYLIDILMALQHLHAHDLVHVDVKPANIFISSDGICKLGDFGLVLDLNKDDPCNVLEGDSKYLAEEVLNNKPTKAADIFSLGMSILELATDLELPSNGVFWHELRKKIIDEKYIKFLSPDLRRVIAWMIDPDPLARPTASELLNDPAICRYKFKRQLLVAKHQALAMFDENLCCVVTFFMTIFHCLMYPFAYTFNCVYGLFTGTHHATPHSNRHNNPVLTQSRMEATPEYARYQHNHAPQPAHRPMKPVPPFRQHLNFGSECSDEEDGAVMPSPSSAVASSISMPESRLKEPLVFSNITTPDTAKGAGMGGGGSNANNRVNFDNSATSSSSDGTGTVMTGSPLSTGCSNSKVDESG